MQVFVQVGSLNDMRSSFNRLLDELQGSWRKSINLSQTTNLSLPWIVSRRPICKQHNCFKERNGLLLISDSIQEQLDLVKFSILLNHSDQIGPRFWAPILPELFCQLKLLAGWPQSILVSSRMRLMPYTGDRS